MSPSDDETDNQYISFRANERYEAMPVTSISWLTYTSISSSLLSVANATPQQFLTLLPLTPTTSELASPRM